MKDLASFSTLILALFALALQAEGSHHNHKKHQKPKPFQCYACFGVKNCDRGGEQWDCAATERQLQPACKTEFKHIRGKKRVLERSCVDMPIVPRTGFCTTLNDGYTQECYCSKPLCNGMSELLPSSAVKPWPAATAAVSAVVVLLA